MGRNRRGTTARALAAATVAAVIAAVAPAHAVVAQCSVQGTNRYAPPLSGTDETRTVRGDATVMCASDAGPISGARSLGNVWTQPGTGWKWQEPAGVLTGSCTSTTINGTYVIRWSDGAVTVLQQSTTSNTWAVRASGAVVADVTLTAVDRVVVNGDPEDPASQPATLTVATTRFAGHVLNAVKASHPNPADPLECTNTGIASAARTGTFSLTVAP